MNPFFVTVASARSRRQLTLYRIATFETSLLRDDRTSAATSYLETYPTTVSRLLHNTDDLSKIVLTWLLHSRKKTVLYHLLGLSIIEGSCSLDKSS